MEAGTKFCPDHIGVPMREYIDHCPICNKPLVTYPGTGELMRPAPPDLEPSKPEEEYLKIEVKPLDPHEPEPVKETFKNLHERITADGRP